MESKEIEQDGIHSVRENMKAQPFSFAFAKNIHHVNFKMVINHIFTHNLI
jgi:hypothetical protein